MAELITDSQIASFVAEQKPLLNDFLLNTQLKPKHGHEEAEVAIAGSGGQVYQIRVRRSLVNPFAFSVILLVKIDTGWFRVRRYNGSNHEHTNRIERNRFRSYHVHYATERYQLLGGDEDGYAEPTDRYHDVHTALQCLVDDCACIGSLGDPMLPF